ncbi:hypothetical protein D046_6830B, partial [Vibrio parahaemolyticus V-223/04]
SSFGCINSSMLCLLVSFGTSEQIQLN